MSNFLNFAGNSGVTFKTFTASGGTTYTLDKSASTNSVLVSVGGVLQKPATDYSVSGTTLTTTSTVTTGIVIDTYIIHDAGNAPVIEDNSIVTAKIADSQVTTAKIADSQITRGKLDLISTSSEPGATIKGDGTTDGYIQLNCSQNSHGIKLKSPAHSAGASYTLVLPTTDGNANEFLQTNGSGVTTWAAAGGGGYEFISKTNVAHDNSGDIEITGLTAYHTYKIFLWSVSNSSTSGTTEMQTSNDGGSSWNTSNYRWTTMSKHTNDTNYVGTNSNGASGWVLFPSGTETGDFPQSAEITLFRGRYDDANRTDNRTHMVWHGFRTSNSGGYGYQYQGAGWQTTGSESNAANAIKFMKNGGGALQHGHIIVLGLKES